MTCAEVDVLVVGAGSAGCLVAAELARTGREVLLLEAGGPEPSVDQSVLPIGPGNPAVWAYRAEFGGGPAASRLVPRGRGVGGSAAVNGGYFVPPDAGFAGTSLPGLAAAVREVWRRFAPRVEPGDDAVTRAFRVAFPDAEALPRNVRDGRRVTSAGAWDLAATGAVVRCGAEARVLLLARVRGGVPRVTGVVCADGTRVRARTTILCAGAIGTAALLLRSRIPTTVPVGIAAEEHPELLVPVDWGVAGRADGAGTPPLAARRRARIRGELVEFRPYTRPFGWMIDPAPGPVASPVAVGNAVEPTYCGVALLGRRPRAAVELRDDEPVVRLDGPDAREVAVLAAAVDRLGPWLCGRPVPGTSQHLAGTARVGEVVDGAGRVRGLRGLAVMDGAALPALPAGGPHVAVLATALLLARRWSAESAVGDAGAGSHW